MRRCATFSLIVLLKKTPGFDISGANSGGTSSSVGLDCVAPARRCEADDITRELAPMLTSPSESTSGCDHFPEPREEFEHR
jgi:hypothetical protein